MSRRNENPNSSTVGWTFYRLVSKPCEMEDRDSKRKWKNSRSVLRLALIRANLSLGFSMEDKCFACNTITVGIFVGEGFLPTGQGFKVAGVFIHVVVVGEGVFLMHLMSLKCHILNFMVGGLMKFEEAEEVLHLEGVDAFNRDHSRGFPSRRPPYPPEVDFGGHFGTTHFGKILTIMVEDVEDVSICFSMMYGGSSYSSFYGGEPSGGGYYY